MTIADIISRWADRSPDAPAILSAGRSPISYGQLFEHLCKTRDLLREMQVAPQDSVAIILPNGPEMALSFLGVSASAVAAPLNPAYSAREFEFYFDDLKPRAVILEKDAESSARDVALARSIPIIETAVPASGPLLFTTPGHSNSGRAQHTFARPSDIALILHTSGTTARPKKVSLTHSNLCHSAQNTVAALQLTTSDRCLNVMPLFHIHGLVAALLSSLAAGASVVCTPGFLAPQFLSWLSEHQPTWYTAMPTIHQAIVARAAAVGAPIPKGSLRFVRSASAALDAALLKAIEDTFRVPVIEAYGMTEAAHQVASNPLPPLPRKPGSVGLPAGPEVAVADSDGNLLPRGERGEIVIRGETVISGYTGNDEANRAALVRGWFRTGDSGHIDSDGYIFLTGRIKEIISRGAEKISPAEIEEVLLKHSAVAQAVVFSVPDQRLGEDVGAAVVPKLGAQLEERLLRVFVARHLADFKVPRVIHIVDAIPVGHSGKIQRSRLAEQLGSTGSHVSAQKTHFIAPRTEREWQLAGIWEDVLDIPSVGVEDDFFLIGGDSILATILMVRVAETLKRQVAVVDFIAAPTISGMLAAMDAALPDQAQYDDADIMVPIQPHGSARPVFCLPPMDGSFLGFARLAAELGDDQPLWGFAPRNLDTDRWSYSMEEIATDYLRAMRARQPAGPYTLVGDCFGGFVAYEMAVQLRRGGDEVALLVMVDTFLQSGWKHQSPFLARVAQRLRHGARRTRFQAAKLRALGAGERAIYLRGRVAAFGENLKHRFVQTLYNGFVRLQLNPPRAARHVRYANVRAEQRYAPQPCDARALLFTTTSPSAAVYPSPLMGWEDLLTGNAQVTEVPGDHQSRFLAGAVGAIAQRLRPELERVPSRHRCRVTIGLPVYNGERYLAAAIESILAQTFRDFELVVVDNASTDGTRAICERYTSDERVHYVRRDSNIGAAPNYNGCVELAHGEYFKWAAYDDLLAPAWLEKCVAVLDSDPSAVLCHSMVTDIDPNGVDVGRPDSGLDKVGSRNASVRFANLVLSDHDCTDVFALMRTDALRRTRLYAPYIASDRVLLAELGLLGRYAIVPELLFFLRQHQGRSVHATTFHKRSYWFDPAGKSGRRVFPHWRVYGEFFLLVRRVCRKRGVRWSCYAQLLKWPWKNWNWARLASDLVIGVWPKSDEKLTAIGRRLAGKHANVIP